MADFQGSNAELTPQGGAVGTQGSSYLYEIGTSPNTRTAVSQKVRILTGAYNNDNRYQMGVLSSFNPSESRTVEPVRGIGQGDTILELVPSVTEPMSLAFERALLYLANLWQATGYAAGIDGPVRSLRHHRWPFDIEQQIVFSTLADGDLPGAGFNGTAANQGFAGQDFTGGAKQQDFSDQGVTTDNNGNPVPPNTGHTALVTMYEACWFQDWNTTFAKDSGMIMESGTALATDVHDMNSQYGEFLATGNDPSIGQLGSSRHAP